jgi:ankyrin repeat protein
MGHGQRSNEAAHGGRRGRRGEDQGAGGARVGHQPDRYGNTPLLMAALGQHVKAMSALVELGADTEVHCRCGTTALFVVIAGGFVAAARTLVTLGANKEAKFPGGATPLHFAAAAEQLEVHDERADAAWRGQGGEE